MMPSQHMLGAAAGVELLSLKDLEVPLRISIGGQLSVLLAMLNAITKGELVVVPPNMVIQEEAQEEAPKAKK